MSESNLVVNTRDLVRARMKRQTRKQIAEGAGVNPHWLEKFSQGAICNPTIERLEKLREYLLIEESPDAPREDH